MRMWETSIGLARSGYAIIFTFAGAAKLLSPLPLQHALRELGLHVGRLGIKAIGVTELVTAVLLVLVDRPLANLLLGSCGVAIMVAGSRGFRSRAILPCGCFGSDNSRPIGMVNAAFGVSCVVLSVVAASFPTMSRISVTATFAAGLGLIVSIRAWPGGFKRPRRIQSSLVPRSTSW